MNNKLAEATRVYREAKRIKDDLTRQYKERVKELDKIIDKARAQMLAELNEMGLKSVVLPDGTKVQRVIQVKPHVMDWEAFHAFVLETGALDLLQRRIAQRNTIEWAKEHDTLPPGVQVEEEYIVRVTAKKESNND